MLKKVVDGILAGIMIAIGGCVFLSLYADNKIIGAILFSVALLSICFKGYSLFTGKVGFIPLSHTKEDFSVLLLGLLGNAIATIFLGIAVKFAMPSISDTATLICSAKLDQTFFAAILKAFFCGILMYMAVAIFKEHKSVSGIFFCVPVFILSGFEHSIANLFYFAASDIVSLKAFLYIVVIIIGNAIGGMVLPALSLIGGNKNASK